MDVTVNRVEEAAPFVPRYGEGSLADVPHSLLAALGARDTRNVLALPPAERICLLIVDGLGAELLAAHPGHAPFLSGLAGRTLTAGFPATTVTSLGSLAIGVPPGEHGMLGPLLAVPGTDHLFNCLRWTMPDGLPPMDPARWQPATTVFQSALAAGLSPAYVAPAEYEGTGLTDAVYRGVRYLAADTIDERVTRAREALSAPRAYVTVYYGEVDSTGHRFGWGAPEWLEKLAVADRLAERLAGALPSGSALYVTADHGMVNVTDKIDAEGDPALSAGVRAFGGDARARHVYTVPGAAAAVLAAWRDRLAGRAWVVSREEAVDSGWFGPRVSPAWLRRIGDVLAVPYTATAIVAPRALPSESRFTGFHGSLTSMEQLIPLVEFSTR